MNKDRKILVKASSKIPLWIRIILSAGVALVTAFALYWIAWLISKGTCSFHFLAWGLSSVFIWLAGFFVRQTGDKLGFGKKRIILSAVSGSVLIVVLAGTVLLYMLLGLHQSAK